MSVAVQDIYDRVCEVLLENSGLVLGLYTEAQFLHAVSVILLDFSQRAALDKQIFTTMIKAGVPLYSVPDDVQKPELCFVGGKLIEKVMEPDLVQGHFEWRKRVGPPRQWHEDNLAPKRMEVFPKPDRDGVNIPGDGPIIGVYGDFLPSQRNLTMVGPAAPSTNTWTLDDVLDVPDLFGHYLVYGILEQVFDGENELRDPQRAAYCRARWQECFALSDCIADEELMENGDV